MWRFGEAFCYFPINSTSHRQRLRLAFLKTKSGENVVQRLLAEILSSASQKCPSKNVKPFCKKTCVLLVWRLLETGMAWFWSDARIKKWSKIEGLNYLKENAQDGIIFVGVHFLTLELGARIVGLHHPGIGVYRPNDNPVLDWLQIKGRLRSKQRCAEPKKIGRGNDSKLYAEAKPFGMRPITTDGRKNAVFVPFLCCTRSGNHDGRVTIYLNPHQIAKSCLLPHYVIKMAQAIRSVFRHQWILRIFQMKLTIAARPE